MGAGVGLGALVGGPAGLVVGGAIGLVAEGLNALIESRADVPTKFVRVVNAKVDPAIANNSDGPKVKVAVQNATQGVILGAGIGIKGGFSIGWIRAPRSRAWALISSRDCSRESSVPFENSTE